MTEKYQDCITKVSDLIFNTILAMEKFVGSIFSSRWNGSLCFERNWLNSNVYVTKFNRVSSYG